MSRTRYFLVLLPVFVILCIVPGSNSASSQDKPEAFWQGVQIVQDILAGKNIEQAKAMIAPGARIVCGEHFEYLKSVVAGEIKACSHGTPVTVLNRRRTVLDSHRWVGYPPHTFALPQSGVIEDVLPLVRLGETGDSLIVRGIS